MTWIRNTHMQIAKLVEYNQQREQTGEAIQSIQTVPAQKSVPSQSRRGFMKWAAMGALAVFVAPALPGLFVSHAAEKGAKNMLVVYFSYSGNTRQIAEQIHQRVGGDLVELKTVTSYPTEYKAVVDQAKQEQQADARPQLAGEIINIDAYDTVFIGYPNWWGTMPMPLFTFLEKYTFAGKNIVPFCTHEGSALGRSARDIAKMCPRANVLEGLAVKGSRVADAQGNVDKWLNRLGLSK